MGEIDLARESFNVWTEKLKGFREWYDPNTGEGRGAVNFMASASLYLRAGQELGIIQKNCYKLGSNFNPSTHNFSKIFFIIIASPSMLGLSEITTPLTSKSFNAFTNSWYFKSDSFKFR